MTCSGMRYAELSIYDVLQVTSVPSFLMLAAIYFASVATSMTLFLSFSLRA